MAAALKLTAARSKAICAAVRTGASRAVAAEAAGVSKSSLQSWLTKGEAANAAKLYRDFAASVRAADADAEVYALGIIRQAMSSDWRSAAWFLEHAGPRGRYFRVDRHELTAAGGEALDLSGSWDLAKLSEHELAQLQKLAERAGADD